MTDWKTITVERRDRVGLITLNRPDALNALNLELMRELVAAASDLDADTGIGAIVITGAGKAFAAGADIKEMVDNDYVEMYAADWFSGWSRFTAVRTPIIAAVSGYALGGGCELAMMCDIIIAGDTAKFGQPEIKLGVIPGMGGSQRLTRAIGKARAMDLILTGRTMDAVEAERAGLVSRVVPADAVLDEAMSTAATIGSLSLPITMMAKEVVNAAYETMLESGIRFERRVFHATFATEDQKEGMSAFVEKRDPEFKNR
ncbi:enoyl-CoA hydratase [Cryobacterium mesophilum]|uniref:Probable enoyl-CoA hydratase echA8 n=1 Tax=Terrimesophilobacter mesophilus TaxID=433647 RepID=A0A4R8VBU5_9MICO|nr:enoyl-CoA hydratase [Terrimesophilobacter mesophilus]MBB5632710.1 enoyl-CoA hydratase [Terrimesophilobacter mesophilus]TFB79512.1 enoyl-CoA hydratase [Terrimesophilobacter mesophilus]